MNKQAYLQGFIKQASKNKLHTRVLSMALKDLERLSPEAARERTSGVVPIYAGNPGKGKPYKSLFGGGMLPSSTAGEQPTMTQHLVRTIRQAQLPKSRYNYLFRHWEEIPGQGDLLAKKKPGSVAALMR